MVLQIDEPNRKRDSQFSLFDLGFRIFFLAAGVSAVFLMSIWLSQLNSNISVNRYYSASLWHAHEMLFGFSVAVISGFLLTAANNWTGLKTISGWRLLLLFIVWLCGRITPLLSSSPDWLIASTDLLFLPLVALLLAIPIYKVKQWSNFIFVPVLLIMSVANLLVHLSTLDLINIPAVVGIRMMLYMVILLIVIMGGRVIPFFTERGVPGVTVRKWKWIEILVPLSLILVAFSDVIYGDTKITGLLALFAGVIHSIRLGGWYSNKIWSVPIVWVLHIAYGWIIIGLLLKSLSLFTPSATLFAYHAFTVGGIGVMTLGMMARVSLGHTGREMKTGHWLIFSFVLLNVAALFRVLLPFLITDNYMRFINISAGLWIVSFILFVIIYAPMLIKPRIDAAS